MYWNEILEIIQHKLVIELGFILAGTLVLAVLSRRILKLLARPPAPEWLISLLTSVAKASPLLVIIYGMMYAVEAAFNFFPHVMAPKHIVQGRYIFLASSFCWLILRWKKVFIEGLNKRIQASPEPLLDPTALFALNKLISILIVLITGMLVLDLIGVPVSTLLAFGGVGGLAISWAAKDVIANFFGGLMIYINRPFSAGDWIKSTNKNFEGVVEEIGWYRTQIRSFERRPTYIPNAMITDATIENPGRMYNRRIKTDIGLRYQDIHKVDAVVNDIRTMLRGHPEIDQKQIMLVHMLEYSAYSLTINIYTFTKTTNWEKYRDVQQDVFLKIADIVRRNGADFAFPTQTLIMNSQEKSPDQP